MLVSATKRNIITTLVLPNCLFIIKGTIMDDHYNTIMVINIHKV